MKPTRSQRGVVDMNGAVGMLIVLLIVILIIVVIFKVLERL